MLELGEIEYTEEEKAYARKYTNPLPETVKRGTAALIKKYFSGVPAEEQEKMASEPLLPYIFPCSITDAAMPGSTDVGDASWIAPTAQLLVTTYPAGLPPHSWQWVASGKSSIMHKGLLYAGRAMAMTALDVIDDPALLAESRREHEVRRNGEKYNCAIPSDVKPR
jgi:aminobenzoyl-glutamate utilization protein B